MAGEHIATRDWHTRARVRIKETITKHSPEGGEHTFSAGEELEMLQWGRAGRTVMRDSWWSSFDIDGAFILKASEVEVVEILDETLPWDEQQEDTRSGECVECGRYASRLSVNGSCEGCVMQAAIDAQERT